MAIYDRLDAIMAAMRDTPPPQYFQTDVIPYLIEVWLRDYDSRSPKADVNEVSSQGFSYLFDIAESRLLSAWGISRGKMDDPRDRSRMAQFPNSGGPHMHRGHAIPHQLGGPLDINLVPQRGSLNVGQFKVLEGQAAASPGSLYFTYWSYMRSGSQTPTSVDQGLIIPGNNPVVRVFTN